VLLRFFSLLALLLLPLETAFAAQVAITDDTGQKISLVAPASRIVTLYAGFDDILATLGREGKIIARTQTEAPVPALMDLPTVGTHLRPNLELVIGAGPDLVIQLGGREAAVGAAQELRSRGLPVAVFDISSLEGLFSAFLRLGILTGSEAEAEAVVRGMRERLDRVRRIVANEPKPRTALEIRYPPLLLAGSRGIAGDIVRSAGGTLVPSEELNHVPLGLEGLIALAPEVYIIQQGPMNPTPEPPAVRDGFAQLPAVKNSRVLMIDERIISRPGPRNLEAVERIAAFLHPGKAEAIRTGAPQ